MYSKPAKPKIFLPALKIAVLSVGLAFFVITPVLAEMVDVGQANEMNLGAEGASINAIKVSNKSLEATTKTGFLQRLQDQLKTWSKELTLQKLKIAGDVAYKQALKYFLNTLAYDMATYIATGDKGQLPMFETQGWGGYLQNVADNTAGTFIEQLGKNSPIKFNLCNPNLNVMLKINLGLMQAYRPKAPACTFSQMTKNWDTALTKKDFLNNFQDMFNPWSNDLGIALTLQTGISSQIDKDVNAAINTRQEAGGFKAVTEPISGLIKTPGNLVREAAGVPLKNATDAEKLYTGSIIADSIDIFINTLAGKLLQRWLRGGLVTNFPSLPNALNGLTNPNSQNQTAGVTGAQGRMKSIVEPNFKTRADYDILAELASCPDPTKAGPTNCVIDEKFRQAIEKKMTVGQALKEGYLNGGGIFGFTADGLEPKFPAVYPYRSMIILRKYRIIPVGWEVAAQKIKDLQGMHCSVDGKSCNLTTPCSGLSQTCDLVVDGTKNLKDLVDCFSSSGRWCSGLVDPDWVLKAPQNFCAREGAGPEIISEQVTGTGADSSLSILRNDTYCADEQSVITEKSDGSPVFGYCTEERRKWDFNANSCEPLYNTCQTFGAANGQANSYLENTLDFSDCNLGNAGCKKYATAGNYDAASKTIAWNGSSNPIYLNKQAESCDSSSEGCHALIRITPGKDETYESIETAGINKAYERIKSTDSASSLQAGLIHEKLLPDYLQSVCYSEAADGKSYEPQPNAPAECSNFARQCKKEETGCELYTSVANETKIPAKVAPDDYCPAECVGYNTFVQSETTFDDKRDAYFIPKTAKTCSAEASGCDQFTNLDEVAKGGEGLEYYSYLRQCVKKSDNVGSCGEFYNWEGSDESGYQLKVESLKKVVKVVDGISKEYPATTDNDPTECTYGLQPGQDGYELNKDCREFYSRNGDISHYIFSKTITCTDDCHPYRHTELNVDENITTAAGCGSNCTATGAEGVAKCWDDTNKQCNSCKNGGNWSVSNQACIYMAVPGQGVTCSASQTGCREYAGNTGNDIRNIFTDDFSGGVGSWVPASALACSDAGKEISCVQPANESINVDLSDNKGHSILVSVDTSVSPKASAKRPVGNAVTKGKSYTLSFLAKAAAGTVDLDISLATSTANGLKAAFALVENVGAGWQIYKTNLTDLNHEVTADEFLLIKGSQNFYIDNITLTEIVDRFYLIKNSWRTPDACYNDVSGAYQGPMYNLGCDQYADRASKTHNLRQFNKLCPESAVGCELMIDTHNSTDANASYYQNGRLIPAFCSGADCVTVPADSFAYVAYDPEKLCGADEKGCELLGKSYQYDGATLYGDIYLKNNPDKYKTILCGANAVGCDVFAYDNGAGDNGEKYFKDPGDMVCEYRQQQAGVSQDYGWYRKKVKRCGGNGAVCLSNADCISPATCLLETGDDKPCATSDSKTFGLGGVGNLVSQPSGNGWAGICPEAESGCTEYLDPKSSFSSNIIFNGSFQKLAVDPTDGWTDGGSTYLRGFSQNVTLEPKTVYRLSRSGGLVAMSCLNGNVAADNVSILNSSNTLAPAGGLLIPGVSAIYYNASPNVVSCKINVDVAGGTVELKKVVLDYQLRQNLDKQTCNGIVDSRQGCILFNERKQSDSGLAGLSWNTDVTQDGHAPSGDGVNNNSNVILKVTPDRVCDKWLACKSYIKDAKDNNICFDVGLCNAVDGNGNCQSFITSKKENQLADGPKPVDISNLSGYSKVGLVGGPPAGEAGSLISDYYPFGAMEQKGEVANFSNGGFEYYGSNLYPVGWTWGGQTANRSWDASVFSVINNPIAAQTEGIGYAREGAAFLKLGSSYDAVSEQIDVIPGKDYIITAYVNTKNLKSGTSSIDILNSAGAVIKYVENGVNKTGEKVITQDLGNDWNFQMGKFNTGVNSQIKIKLYSSVGGALTSSEGNFYYDDIKIRPALNSKTEKSECLPGYCVSDKGADPNDGHCSNKSNQPCHVSNDRFWYTPQSCRLYPQSDSLSCDYYEASGKRQKGWPGYCLEYDRRPGDPNTCLLWYPIDKVKGDGIEEGAGYAGKAPVFYCAKATSYCDGTNTLKSYCDTIIETVSAVGQNKYWSARTYLGSDYEIPFADSKADKYIDWGAVKGGKENIVLNYSRYDRPFGSIVPPNPVNNPYEWDGETNTETNVNIQPLLVLPPGSRSGQVNAGTPYYSATPNVSCVSVEGSLGACDFVDNCSSCNSNVSEECGTPFNFNSRVGSKCRVIEIKGTWDECHFKTYYTDGADREDASFTNHKIYKNPVTNNWYVFLNDLQGGGECDSVTYQCSSSIKYNMAANQTEAINGIKKVFAQSYGVWNWVGTSDSGRYTAATPNQDWGPPGTNGEPNNGLCNGDGTGVRVANDYCAIPPKITNVKVNGSLTGPITLTNSQIVKLSFNTKVDSQQLPLVMYGVDWGDGSNTMVTGVEMYDKPNPDQPEVIYHLYSYWDLKAKKNSGTQGANIHCYDKCSSKFAGSGDAACCAIKPQIQIKDNWGWCNNAKKINDCVNALWDKFGGETPDDPDDGWVVVKEK